MDHLKTHHLLSLHNVHISKNDITIFNLLLDLVESLVDAGDHLQLEGRIAWLLYNNLHLGGHGKASLGSIHSKACESNISISHPGVILIPVIPSFHKNLLLGWAFPNQIKTALGRETESVSDIFKEAVFVVVAEEIFPHAFFHTDLAFNHLVLAKVGLDLIQGSLEGAASDLVRAGDVCEGGDEVPAK